MRTFPPMTCGMTIIYLKNVSNWVAFKVRSIALWIGVAISGHEKEVAHLLRIEKKNCTAKQASQRNLAIRKQRELRRLEFGVTYGKGST